MDFPILLIINVFALFEWFQKYSYIICMNFASIVIFCVIMQTIVIM